MIPIKLTLSGFLSYRDPVELDFTLFDLACIAGPNGAGKSSLLDALTWALFGKARRSDDALINTRCDVAEVSLIFAYENNIYRVLRAKQREKTAVLELHIHQGDVGLDAGLSLNPSTLDKWKPLTERTLRETEARLQQILRLDYETFVNASFFLQGKADQFTLQSNAKRKRILSSILGLEIWEAYRTRAAERRREVEKQIGSLHLRLEEINQELAQEESRRKHLVQLRKELHRLEQQRAQQEKAIEDMRTILTLLDAQKRLVEDRRAALQTAQERLKSLNERLLARQGERQGYVDLLARAKQIEDDYATLQQARRELEHWEGIAARYRQAEQRRQQPLEEIRAAQARLTQELETLRKRQQEVESQQAQTKHLQESVFALQRSIQKKEERLAQRPALETELQDCQQRREQLSAENRTLQSEMQRLKERIDRLEATQEANCPLCGQPLATETRQNLIASLKEDGKKLGERYRANQQHIAELEQQAQTLKKRLNELSRLEGELRQEQRTLGERSASLEHRQQQWVRWEEQEAPRLAEVQQILEQESYAPEARALLVQIEQEMQALGYDAAMHEAVRQTEQEHRHAEEEIRQLEVARTALAGLEREIDHLQHESKQQQGELERINDAYRQALHEFEELQKKAPDLRAAERELIRLREEENLKRAEVAQADQGINVLEQQKVRHAELTLERERLTQLAAHYQQLERAFGRDGVPALIIEQAIPQIQEKANQILQRLSMGSMAVRFVTQLPYKDKHREDLQEVLDIFISDALGDRAYEMYSGGEAFRVNFAIRLALSEMLASRAGARLQTLVIDEGFGSQDEQGRQRLIEAINEVRKDFAKILVITHLDELKDHFPTRIEVEKSERGSTLRVL